MKFIVLIFFYLHISASLLSQIVIKQQLCENKVNPNGIDARSPRFTWIMNSDQRNVMQTAYEIRVSADHSGITRGRNLLWNSGKVTSDQSVLVRYAGTALQPDHRYYWQVRVWDNKGKQSPWSPVAFWQTGFFEPAGWIAKWIKIGFEEDSIMRPSPMFRKAFSLRKSIRSATIYITAHGMYEATLNGKRIGDDYLTPGWTSYNKRLQYQAYDVTHLLQTGNNALGVSLGNGWFRGNLAWGGLKDIYGKELALLCQLSVRYTDGSSEKIISDESWKSNTGAIVNSEIYHGETYDARLEHINWTLPSYNDRNWKTVQVVNLPKGHLIATQNQPIKKHERFKPVRIFTTPSGENVVDFGQNLVGWVQLKAAGNAGHKIKLTHAEVLDKNGNFYTANLRAAKQENSYILSGRGVETFEPHFTFQGFRYVKVENFPGQLNQNNIEAIALYSAMPVTGAFTSSHKLINQLQHNIQWGQKGNFLDVPTDCPQRDERLGWTGDAQVFARTASFNMNVHNFFSKWLKDVAADQQPNGSVPFVVPNMLGPGAGASAGWADAATIIPWTMYLAYGDSSVLRDQYPSMKAWVGYMEKNSSNDLWNKGFHFGDWLFYRPDDDNDGRSAVTDKYLIAQCFFAHSTQILLNAATILGKNQDIEYYSNLLRRIKDAFTKEYVTSNGRLVSNTQTAYVLALNFNMLADSLRQQAAGRLVKNIQDYNHHLTTGFLGTPYLCHVLTRFGYTDVAYKLLMQETYPSWLYPVKMGATTIWERWDGQKPDSTFQTPNMNSFNHYAYGAIGDYMYRVIAGIDTDSIATGYKKIIIHPHTGDGLTNASATLQTYYGGITSSWKLENKKLALDIEIPVNTTARVYFPAGDTDAVSESGQLISSNSNLQVNRTNGYMIFDLGSGRYSFQRTDRTE